VDQVSQLLRSRVLDKGLNFEVVTNPKTLPYVDADSLKIRQIMVNLLGNAVKFTEDGKIRLEVAAKSKNSKEGELTIHVSDTGVGIPSDKKAQIFEAFTQGDASITRRFGGTGLGLTLSKQMVELLGGKIWFESEVDKGSVFSFSVPAKILAKKIEKPREEQYDEVSSAQHAEADVSTTRSVIQEVGRRIDGKSRKNTDESPLILIIEDNGSALELLQRYLEKDGYRVQCSTKGEDGVLKAKFFRPSAIILEILLPGKMDGWEVLRTLKSGNLTKEIPVIVCSVLSNQKKAFSMGAVEYIEKPAHEKVLIETLHRSIGIPTDKSKEVVIVDDDKTVLILFEKLLSRQGINVKTFDNGKDAIEYLEHDHKIAMVILDLLMPDVDGFEVLQKMKSSDKTKDIPVVIYTGKQLTAKDRSKLSRNYELLLEKTQETPETLLKQLNQLVSPKIEKKKEEVVDDFGNILLAEDDPSAQKLMRHLLNQLGYQVDLVGTGKQVLSKLKKKKYDIILMDMEMPVMDGFTATIEIRKMAQYNDLPIIALTAHAMKEHRTKTFEAGCTDYIPKPVNRKKLDEILTKYSTRKKKVLKAKKKIVKQAEQTAITQQSDDDVMAELTSFFVSDLGQRIQQFKEDVVNKNKDEIVRFGHSLKGTAGSYGFPQFSKLGGEIEIAGKSGEWEKIMNLKKSILDEYKLLGS